MSHAEDVNPYFLLGLDETATQAEVRAAFLRAAKMHHPDAGGDANIFEEIKFAYDLLRDEERRARFDATGDTRDAPANNDKAESVFRASVALKNATLKAQALAKQTQPNRSPLAFDLIALAKIEIVNHIEILRARIPEIDERLAFQNDLSSRFVKQSGDDFIARIFKDEILKLTSALQDIDTEIRFAEGALAAFEGYSFRKDEDLQMPMMVSFFGEFS